MPLIPILLLFPASPVAHRLTSSTNARNPLSTHSGIWREGLRQPLIRRLRNFEEDSEEQSMAWESEKGSDMEMETRCFVSKPGSSEGDTGRGEHGRSGERDIFLQSSGFQLSISLKARFLWSRRTLCFGFAALISGRRCSVHPIIGSLLNFEMIIAMFIPIGLQKCLSRYYCRKIRRCVPML